MKIKLFNKSNVHVIKTSAPTIRINKDSGAIAFNITATAIVRSCGKKGIEFCQDETKQEDWFIIPSDNKDAFIPRIDSGRQETFIVQSTALAKKIMHSCNIQAQSAGFIVAKEPIVLNDMMLYPIITKSAK